MWGGLSAASPGTNTPSEESECSEPKELVIERRFFCKSWGIIKNRFKVGIFLYLSHQIGFLSVKPLLVFLAVDPLLSDNKLVNVGIG